MENYDSDFWGFVGELIILAEQKKFGKNIFKWIEKQHARSKEDMIDLDEKMSEHFGFSEDKAGKILVIYVKHKAGGFDEKAAIKQMDAVK